MLNKSFENYQRRIKHHRSSKVCQIWSHCRQSARQERKNERERERERERGRVSRNEDLPIFSSALFRRSDQMMNMIDSLDGEKHLFKNSFLNFLEEK